MWAMGGNLGFGDGRRGRNGYLLSGNFLGREGGMDR